MAKQQRVSRPPADRTAWFRHDRFGMFIHWGLYAIPARGEWVRSFEKISTEAYEPYFREFNPTRYDPRAWARLARRAGQQYAIITAKHHEGFCLFDSDRTGYKATNTPAGRDLLKEFVNAFRAEGLKIGFYYSLLDWHHPDYPVVDDWPNPMRDDPEAKAQKRDFSRYIDYLHAQVRELLTGYGRIDLLWFDFSYGRLSGEAWRASQLVSMIRKLQPHIILNNRLVAGHENPDAHNALGDLHTPEQTIPAEGVRDAAGRPVLWEACITMNNSWGYNRDDHAFKTPTQLVRMLVECVSKGGNLLLNVGPNAMGEIQWQFQRDLNAIGCWMDANGDSIYGCGPADLPKPDWGRYTLSGDGKRLYAHIFERPIGPVAIVGMGSRVKRARLLMDGSEVNTIRPWNVNKDSPDLFLNLPNTLPDPMDTVVGLDLQ